MKKFIKPMLYSLLIIFLGAFILTFLNYIGLISGIFLNIIKVLLPFISYFIGGVMIGKISDNKGWLNGIILSFIITIILFLICLIFDCKMTLYTFLFYIGLIIVSTFGSMIGINKKTTE